MKGILIRVGIDSAYGRWNAPVCFESGHFAYVPIPEKIGTKFKPGLERSYSEVLPSLKSFCMEHHCDLEDDLCFPAPLQSHPMHLDPDFETLTYGDQGERRGLRLRDFTNGDIVAFYAGLRPIKKAEQRLIYALIGLYVINEIVRADDVEKSRWNENAHTRKFNRGTPDIVVRAKPKLSGRLDRCIPIGEWRSRAYRVKNTLLEEWGGLSVQDGYIQRSVVPPVFLDPQRFYKWFLGQKSRLISGNF